MFHKKTILIHVFPYLTFKFFVLCISLSLSLCLCVCVCPLVLFIGLLSHLFGLWDGVDSFPTVFNSVVSAVNMKAAIVVNSLQFYSVFVTSINYLSTLVTKDEVRKANRNSELDTCDYRTKR